MTTKQDLERQLQEVTAQINRCKDPKLIKHHEKNRAKLVSQIMDFK